MFFLISGLILMSYITVTFCKTTSSKTLFSYWWKLDGEICFLSGTWQCKLHSEHYYITLINVVHINKIYILTLYSGYFGKNPGILGSRYHGSACPTPFPITAHTLTWSHLSLIEHTCNHSPLPFISSLTSVTRRLVSRSQGCMYAALYTGHCLPVCPSVLDLVPAWGNASLRTVRLYLRLPKASLLYRLCWKPCLSYIE